MLIEMDSRYCDEHLSVGKAKESNRQVYYDRLRRDQQSNKFYKSREWESVRLVALVRDNYLCVHCNQDKRVSAARFIGGKIRGFRQDDWRYQVVVFTDNSLMPSVQ